ncbi:hypothetical protein FRC09_005761 [Ceratobasidium sp. 395]|nr:hypothetical protein FRC09_005761 [Ceratobasidium sp. 395]
MSPSRLNILLLALPSCSLPPPLPLLPSPPLPPATCAAGSLLAPTLLGMFNCGGAGNAELCKASHVMDLVLAVVSPIPYLCHIARSGTKQYGLGGDGLMGYVQTLLGESPYRSARHYVGQMDKLDEVINPD